MPPHPLTNFDIQKYYQNEARFNGTLGTKFGVNQHGKALRKQQSLGLRMKKLFPNEDIIVEYFALNYRTDFTFKRHMLAVEIDEKEHADRD